MSRGRPKEEIIVKDKWELTDTNYQGGKILIKFDRSKTSNGPYLFENIPSKHFRQPQIKIEKGKAYGQQPVVLVYKTSNRSNAKIKIKVFANENIDYILSTDKLVGISEKCEILDIGVGKSFIKKYKQKYNI